MTLQAVVEMRDAIRAHRDARGDDRCWLDDYSVWAQLPDTPPEPVAPPAYEDAMKKCRDYFNHRRSDRPPAEADASAQPDADLGNMDERQLNQERLRLQDAIRTHRDVAGRPRNIEDDRALYSALPEKTEADFRLPPEADFLGEARAPHAGCPSFWRSHGNCAAARHNLHRWGPCGK